MLVAIDMADTGRYVFMFVLAEYMLVWWLYFYLQDTGAWVVDKIWSASKIWVDSH